jgi:hypothetical protein
MGRGRQGRASCCIVAELCKSQESQRFHLSLPATIGIVVVQKHVHGMDQWNTVGLTGPCMEFASHYNDHQLSATVTATRESSHMPSRLSNSGSPPCSPTREPGRSAGAQNANPQLVLRIRLLCGLRGWMGHRVHRGPQGLWSQCLHCSTLLNESA